MGIYIDAALELLKEAGGRSRRASRKANSQAQREERAAKTTTEDAAIMKKLEAEQAVARRPKPYGEKEMAEAAAEAKANVPKSFLEGMGKSTPKGHATQKADFNYNIDTKDRFSVAKKQPTFKPNFSLDYDPEGPLDAVGKAKSSLVKPRPAGPEQGIATSLGMKPALSKKPVTPTSIAAGPAAGTVPPVVPGGATSKVQPDVPFMKSPLGWAKRNPTGALLGLAGAGAVGSAGLLGLYSMYANRKLKEQQAAKSGLNPGTLKAAMHKLAMTAPAAPTAPSAAMPLPKPQQAGAMPSGVPSAPQQAQSSTSQPTETQTTGGQPTQQISQSWRQNAATNLQGGQDQQQGGGQDQGDQSQGQ